jgi:hypothetical protein
MATSNLKSPSITNLDAIPVVPNTAGEGAPAYCRTLEGTITPLAGDAIGSTYRLVRLPSNAKVKSIIFWSQAQGAGTFDLSAYYSDSTMDGTAPANQGLIVPTTGAAFFADGINAAAAVVGLQVLGNGGVLAGWTPNLINTQLWAALGLTSDPGGFIDVVMVCADVAVTTGGGQVAISVDYAD